MTSLNRGAAEAIAALEKDTFDLVLADMRMPRLDGCGLCGALRDDPRTRFELIVALPLDWSSRMDSIPGSLCHLCLMGRENVNSLIDYLMN